MMPAANRNSGEVSGDGPQRDDGLFRRFDGVGVACAEGDGGGGEDGEHDHYPSADAGGDVDAHGAHVARGHGRGGLVVSYISSAACQKNK
jgi:hypothetical protein